MRRIICRPKTRFCTKASLLLASISLLLFLSLLADDWNSGTERMVSAIFAGSAILAGAAALVFRFTERPREACVRDRSDWDDPPVIHLKPKP
jgi:hypothetical protein